MAARYVHVSPTKNTEGTTHITTAFGSMAIKMRPLQSDPRQGRPGVGYVRFVSNPLVETERQRTI
ncbi:probable uracil phosphoribosyltransferase [Mycolicibacterium fortuitum subsp. acetamidolyticum]|uniref:Probable uracil phosphoribosyltransferase n=1 Tax=Mycolicibacterium fortuitum subsp. acetamidolyticum TaxID=144550 RepID=A0A117IDK5_MYCFO|nr:probable uracil phosphoribosyltransferase [Mycolicibacterium fortuitum subsp. acetamidolyticum]